MRIDPFPNRHHNAFRFFEVVLFRDSGKSRKRLADRVSAAANPRDRDFIDFILIG